MSNLERLPEGVVYCPNCNTSNRIYLIVITETVDPSVPVDAQIPNVYPVSTLKCANCGTVFDLERVDPRIITSMSIIEFDNNLRVFTTLEPHIAIRKAKKWYKKNFNSKLTNARIISLGSIVYTTDPYNLLIPEEQGE